MLTKGLSERNKMRYQDFQIVKEFRTPKTTGGKIYILPNKTGRQQTESVSED